MELAQGLAVELLIKYRYISDFFIALAYIWMSLATFYFVKRSAVFPYRRVLALFGAFIGLCGATHLLNLWMFQGHTLTVDALQTIVKLLTALVSCATALLLFDLIPDLLGAKRRKAFMKNEAAELDREVGLICTTSLSSLMVETFLKCSNLLVAIHVLDHTRLEDGTVKLESETIDHHSAFKEVLGELEKLLITLQQANDIPYSSASKV